MISQLASAAHSHIRLERFVFIKRARFPDLSRELEHTDIVPGQKS
jgi:hypothetical protein